MTTIKHWAPDAPQIARCPCGGALMLVEDAGGAQPLEAQCRACGVLTGVARAPASPAAPAVSDAQDEMPF